jgi:hypothetical protein
VILFQKIIFDGHLDDGEKLFEVVHRHSIEMWGRTFAWIFLGLIPPLIITWYAHTLGFIYSWWWAVLWIFLSLFWIGYHFIDWYFDALLVTNYSLIHVEWHGVFERESARIEYEDIKEVSYITDGVLATTLDFGDISILSISGGKTSLKNIPKPQEVEQMIRTYKMNYQEFQRFTDGAQLEKILSGMVQTHVWQYGTDHGFLPRR